MTDGRVGYDTVSIYIGNTVSLRSRRPAQSHFMKRRSVSVLLLLKSIHRLSLALHFS